MPMLTYQPADEGMLAPVRAVEAVCARHGVAPGAVALQFSLQDKRIASTIVGVSDLGHINQTLNWTSTKIQQALWDDLAELGYSTEDPEANRNYKPG